MMSQLTLLLVLVNTVLKKRLPFQWGGGCTIESNSVFEIGARQILLKILQALVRNEIKTKTEAA